MRGFFTEDSATRSMSVDHRRDRDRAAEADLAQIVARRRRDGHGVAATIRLGR